MEKAKLRSFIIEFDDGTRVEMFVEGGFAVLEGVVMIDSNKTQEIDRWIWYDGLPFRRDGHGSV